MSDNNCLIVAGEKSGEDHVMTFLPDLVRMQPSFLFWGVGGDEMLDHNVELLYHLNDFSSWGFSDVIAKIPFYKRALDRLCEEAVTRGCKVAILVDFQDFNMRLAKRLQDRGIKVLYYVAPQAWVWKEGRVKALRRNVEKLFTILPFEKQWFLERGVKQVVSVAHPLYKKYAEQITQSLSLQEKSYEWLAARPRLLLLPGSRNFEVASLLPAFIKALSMLERRPEVRLVRSSSVADALYRPYLDKVDHVYEDVDLEDGLKWAGIALAASGTVTLTCALFQVPTVMAYRSSLLNEYIFYNILNYKGYISLANIVHGEEVFPELIQNQASSFNMHHHLNRLLSSKHEYERCKIKLERTKDLLKGDLLSSADAMNETFEEVRR